MINEDKFKLQGQIKQWLEEFEEQSPQQLLAWFIKQYGNRLALASGLGAEGQVLTDMVSKINRQTRIFTIDTGRLFPETYKLIDRTNRKYDINIELYFPNNQSVETYVHNNGIMGFYESVEKRKACCHVRKIEPLQRALSTVDI